VVGDTSNSKGLEHWKQGGTFDKDCVFWTFQRDAWLVDKPTYEDSWRPYSIMCQQDPYCNDWKGCPSHKGACEIHPEFTNQGWCGCKVD